MKYLYISRNQSISFNEDYWYINGIEQKRPIEEIRTTEELAKNGTKQYMRSLLTNLFSHFKHISILTAAGTSMDNVVKTTVFIKEMNDFGKINEIYKKYFKEPFPARSCVEVARLPKDVLLEVEAIAWK